MIVRNVVTNTFVFTFIGSCMILLHSKLLFDTSSMVLLFQEILDDDLLEVLYQSRYRSTSCYTYDTKINVFFPSRSVNFCIYTHKRTYTCFIQTLLNVCLLLTYGGPSP